MDIVDNIVYQDNKSSILLETNGRASSSKRTRHLNVRYFFVKDRVDSGEVRIEYCPTEEMIADYFTKPLQGALFYKMRDLIMNIAPSSEFHSGNRSVLTDKNLNEDPEADNSAAIPENDVEPHGGAKKSYKEALLATQ